MKVNPPMRTCRNVSEVFMRKNLLFFQQLKLLSKFLLTKRFEFFSAKTIGMEATHDAKVCNQSFSYMFPFICTDRSRDSIYIQQHL